MCLLKTTRKYTCEKCYVSKYLNEDWENVAKEAQKAIEEQTISRWNSSESKQTDKHQASQHSHEDVTAVLDINSVDTPTSRNNTEDDAPKNSPSS